MKSDRSTPTMTRRGLLGAALAAGVVLAAEAAPVGAWAADGDVTLSANGVSALASIGGRIAIRDGQATVRSAGSKFQIKDSATGIHLSTGGTPSLVTLADGTPAIRVDYTMPAAAGAVAVHALVTVSTDHVHLSWHVTGPATLVPDGFLFSRAIQNPTEADAYVAITEWVRDDDGGVPYETTLGVAHASTWGTRHGMFLLERSRQAWTNATWIHAPGTTQADGSHLSEADFFFTTRRPSATASIGTSRELGVEIWTDRPFNIWETPGAAMTVNVQVANGSPSARDVALSWWVKDFDGHELAEATVTATVAATSTWEHTFTVAAPANGIALAEVTARSGTDEAFARTNLAVLGPHTYRAGASSMFGMANYPWLQVPSATALLDLWQKVGVNRVRIAYDGGPGLPPSAFDARGMRHNIELQPTLDVTDEVAARWAAANTDKAIAAGADYFEVGNELNRPFNTGVAAQAYIDKALRPVRDRLTATGSGLKLLNNGLAGMDEPWVENFIAGGGWDLIDGFAYHPGRGNVTPDHIPAPGDWDAGAHGAYWNFLGGLRKLQALMAQHGRKDIWLTEAYACTRPNAWWNDTYRQAAENVFLTLAIAKAEGITGVLWYQFHDSVLGMPQVADPGNVEYHFGLMNRDISPKPSLLAYATAARAFDEATPLGWLAFPDPQTKGLLFDTPDGQAAVLWNRADGYTLNTGHDPAGWHFPAPEVWVDHWPTKTPMTVPTTGATLRQLDCIGRPTTIQAPGNRATVVLDGAPRLFTGVDLTTALAD
ncbi:hypothetical protein [Phytomonospora endophytica]|uniref:Uncharacterized protein n=1 Tax=Phytomonospora endophytica TaxID=714109 RepID=A0A841FVY8_9ACTN|nr:hypothetical protein [Phytomonospora endophytica]MBB6037898.1 hypothetical protein [Phytomonospora endophytica]GIG68798.1 hypothetical protein Pen01_50930 [Phytomonospora endophytica]